MIASSPSSLLAIEPNTILKVTVQGSALLAWLWHIRRIPRSLHPVLLFLVMSVAVENGAVIMRTWVGNNTLIYDAWIPVMVTVLSFWLWRAIARSWATLLIGAALAVYFVLLVGEMTAVETERLLFQHSILFAYAYISLLCAIQLVRLTSTADTQLWKDPLFWTYVAFFASLGPAIPYLGLLNQLYRMDRLQADSLFTIIDVLFLVQFMALGIAGALLQQLQPRAKDA